MHLNPASRMHQFADSSRSLGWRVPFPGIRLAIRLHAVVFFALLAVLLDLVIMPWALDAHPLVHRHGLHHLLRITVHASPATRYAGTLALTALIALAGLVHELGHALALRQAGATEIAITLYGAGGTCRAQARDTTPLALLWYAAAGPLATLGVIVVLLAMRIALPLPHTVRALLWLGAAIQAGTLLLNVLPLFAGSDGRHMLHALAALVGRNPGIVAVPITLPVLALLPALQADTRMVLLWIVTTFALASALAHLAWTADRRLPARQPRPAAAGTMIRLFRLL